MHIFFSDSFFLSDDQSGLEEEYCLWELFSTYWIQNVIFLPRQESKTRQFEFLKLDRL